MKKLVIVCFCMACFLAGSKAQNSYVWNYSVPPSPDAYALIRDVNTPVDRYSGVMGVQVPLYEVATGNLKIPVTLNYQASGIKVEDMATSVGLGWRLSAGGKITRVVKRYPDETGFSAAAQEGFTAQDYASWTEANFDNRAKNMDTEPDLFYFEIPGRSGMFIVNYDKTIHTIPYQAVKIEWVNQAYFVLVDENGTKYTFGEADASRENVRMTLKEEDYQKQIDYVSTWNLEKMEGSNGKQVTFSYVSGSEYTLTQNDTRRVIILHNSGESRISETIDLSIEMKMKSPRYLSGIHWGEGEVLFSNSTGRTDIPEAKKLTRIGIYTFAGQFLKAINLDYGTFQNNSLRLDRVYESVTNGNTLLINRFEYYTDCNLPARNSYAYDHWGYFNGANNTKGYPVYPGLEGDNRNPALNYTRANSIKRIYNQAGAYKEFEYSLNQCADGKTLGGLKIDKIREKSPDSSQESVTSFVYSDSQNRPGGECFNEAIIYCYRIGNAVRPGLSGGSPVSTVNIGLTKPLYPLTDVNGLIAGYPRVKEIHPNGSYTLYCFRSYKDCPDIPNRSYNLRFASFDRLSASMVPNTSKFWLRGVLTKMVSYDNLGNEVYGKSISYKTVPGRIREITASVPVSTQLGLHLGLFKWISEPVLVDTISEWGKDVPMVSSVYTYHPDYLLPTATEVTEKATGTKTKTTITYPFQYNVSGVAASSVFAYALKCMNRDYVLNVPVETVEYRDGKVTGGTICEYKTITANGRSECVVPAQVRTLRTNAPVTSFNPYVVTSAGTIVPDSHYEVAAYMDVYDAKGNLLQEHSENGNLQTTLYGYNQTLPVAWVENAVTATSGRGNEVFYTSFEEDGNAVLTTAKSGVKAMKAAYRIPLSNFKPGNYLATYWLSGDGKDWEKNYLFIPVTSATNYFEVGSTSFYIDELCVFPENARMSTCTYLPGVGKLSETDHNGQTRYYEYDAFGRLYMVRDNLRNPLKKYTYYVVPQ